MDSKLVEDIEAVLRDAEYMAHCGKDMESLLKRCLESLRWIPVEERLPEERVDVLCRLNNTNICTGSWASHISESFVTWGLDKPSGGAEWTDREEVAVTHWLPIPQ